MVRGVVSRCDGGGGGGGGERPGKSCCWTWKRGPAHDAMDSAVRPHSGKS